MEKSCYSGKTELDSSSRVLATLKGQPVDRRAVSLTLSLYGANFAECSLAEYYSNY